MYQPQDSRSAPRPIETASATTSPDNANSGPAAYVIAGVTLAFTMLVGFSVSSCASYVVEEALLASEGAWAGAPDPYLDGPRDPYGLEFDDYGYDGYGYDYDYDFDGFGLDGYGLDDELMRFLEEEGVRGRGGQA